MTRTYTKKPVWVWQCDSCGKEEHLAVDQSGTEGLPSMDEMRAQGWFIADSFGDMCPRCYAKSKAEAGAKTAFLDGAQENTELEDSTMEKADSCSPLSGTPT